MLWLQIIAGLIGAIISTALFALLKISFSGSNFKKSEIYREIKRQYSEKEIRAIGSKWFLISIIPSIILIFISAILWFHVFVTIAGFYAKLMEKEIIYLMIITKFAWFLPSFFLGLMSCGYFYYWLFPKLFTRLFNITRVHMLDKQEYDDVAAFYKIAPYILFIFMALSLYFANFYTVFNKDSIIINRPIPFSSTKCRYSDIKRIEFYPLTITLNSEYRWEKELWTDKIYIFSSPIHDDVLLNFIISKTENLLL